MHPARAKAKQTQAIVETAASVSGLREQMDRIEAKLDELLARPDARTPTPTPPQGGRKDSRG